MIQPKNMMLLFIILGIIGVSLWFLKPEQRLGSLLNSVVINQGGILTFGYKTIGLSRATTTPCAIQSPSATSSIVHASFDVRTATGTANSTLMGTSTDTNGIDGLPFGGMLIPANTRGTFVATSTLLNNSIISPSNWVIVTFGQSYGSTVPSGNCEVIFRAVC